MAALLLQAIGGSTAPHLSRAVRPHGSCVAVASSGNKSSQNITTCSRRESLSQIVGIAAAIAAIEPTAKAIAEDDVQKTLCDASCLESLNQKERVTTPSGLQFQDIVVGNGATPAVGYQVVVNYVAMTPEYRVFDSSLERGSPYDIRVGAGAIVAGLDEGLRTMRSGGIRRLYIPGDLSFPKGLPAGPGRPRVPPSSPVVFDVQLLYIPGLDDE